MKRLADRVWFYLCVGVLNLAVGTMFYTVAIRPSDVVAISPRPIISREVEVQSRVIPAIVGTPVRLVIPSLAMDLPVGVGSYNPEDGSWTIDTTKAYYADVSLPVNDSNGRTMIYGHAQAPVFAALPGISAGAVADVYTDNGYVFRYVYTSMETVSPSDTSIFTADGPPTLVLQTCIGPWDAYRGLYSFKLESARKV